MTPLAHRIVKELTLPIKDRTFNDRCGLVKRMDDIHCFDVTEVIDFARSIAYDIHRTGLDERSTFLPAPKTWIEYREIVPEPSDFGGTWRLGWLIEECLAKNKISLRLACVVPDGRCHSSDRAFEFELNPIIAKKDERDRRLAILNDIEDLDRIYQPDWRLVQAVLAIINTPRIIGRRQHMPHRGLERQLLAKKALVGKFPLHAWTEILLKVAPPDDKTGEPSKEAHLTGERALHFCRAHLRIQNGKLVYVSAHWRGNGALGIKRSRYKLAA